MTAPQGNTEHPPDLLELLLVRKTSIFSWRGSFYKQDVNVTETEHECLCLCNCLQFFQTYSKLSEYIYIYIYGDTQLLIVSDL